MRKSERGGRGVGRRRIQEETTRGLGKRESRSMDGKRRKEGPGRGERKDRAEEKGRDREGRRMDAWTREARRKWGEKNGDKRQRVTKRQVDGSRFRSLLRQREKRGHRATEWTDVYRHREQREREREERALGNEVDGCVPAERAVGERREGAWQMRGRSATE